MLPTPAAPLDSVERAGPASSELLFHLLLALLVLALVAHRAMLASTSEQ